MWSITFADLLVIRVGIVITGRKLCINNILTYSEVLVSDSNLQRSILISPTIKQGILPIAILETIFSISLLKLARSVFGCRYIPATIHLLCAVPNSSHKFSQISL